MKNTRFYKKLIKDKTALEVKVQEKKEAIQRYLDNSDFEEVAKLSMQALALAEKLAVLQDTIEGFEDMIEVN